MSFPHTIYGKYGSEKVVDSTKQYRFGQRLELPDGRIFRYSQAGVTALVAGKLYTGGSGVISSDTMRVDNLVVGDAAVGATAVTITTGASAIPANLYDDGYLHTSNSANGGVGEVYKVKSAESAAGTSVACIVHFADGEQVHTVMLSGTTKVGLRQSPYKTLEIHPGSTAMAGPLAGVAPVAIPASSFGWIQRRGPVAAYSESGTMMIQGVPVAAGTSQAGAIDKWLGVASSTQVIGTVMSAAVTSKRFGLIDLNIE